MSTYEFGVSRVRITKMTARKLAQIAEQHGADFVETTLPGTGYQRWFSAPNLGFPFDRSRSEAVYADIRAAGLVDVNGEAL